MSFWNKLGLSVILIVAVIVTGGLALFLYYKRADARRIVKNYGKTYAQLLKEYSVSAKRVR